MLGLVLSIISALSKDRLFFIMCVIVLGDTWLLSYATSQRKRMSYFLKKWNLIFIVLISVSCFGLYANEGPSPLYVQLMKVWAEETNFAENASEVSVNKFVYNLKKDPNVAKYITEALELDLKQFFYEIFISPDTMDKLAELYSEYYTLEELQELITFYKSPIGKKLVETNAQLAKQSQKIGDEILKEREQDYIELISKHILKAKQGE